MTDLIQTGNETAYDRYPDVFYVAKRYLAATSDRPHILSFGCSTGEEPFCLAERYFPKATIVGVDASPDALAVAMRNNTHGDRVMLRHSTPAAIAGNGPYDAIFAMSVLCRSPASDHVEDISHLYRFDRFEEHVNSLDANLKPGGLLSIYNANFAFTDCAAFGHYDIILSRHVRSSGFVKRFDRANQAVTLKGLSDCIYAKRDAPTATALMGMLRFLNEDGIVIGTLPASVRRSVSGHA